MVARAVIILSLLVAGVCAPAAALAQQADVARGGLLYENHCTVCHESTVHVRKDRRVRTSAELVAMINRWANHLELDWSGAEIADVLEYLDARYYRMGTGTP